MSCGHHPPHWERSGFKHQSAPFTYYMILDKDNNSYEPQFPHILNGLTTEQLSWLNYIKTCFFLLTGKGLWNSCCCCSKNSQEGSLRFPQHSILKRAHWNIMEDIWITSHYIKPNWIFPNQKPMFSKGSYMLAPPASTWVLFVLRALFPEIGESPFKSSTPVSIGFAAISIKLLPNIFLKRSMGLWAMQCLMPQCPRGENGGPLVLLTYLYTRNSQPGLVSSGPTKARCVLL